MSEEYPKKMDMDNPAKVIGLFIIGVRNKVKTACKIIDAFEEDGEVRLAYEVITGPDQGKVFNGRYDRRQTVSVYDNGSVMLAIMGT